VPTCKLKVKSDPISNICQSHNKIFITPEIKAIYKTEAFPFFSFLLFWVFREVVTKSLQAENKILKTPFISLQEKPKSDKWLKIRNDLRGRLGFGGQGIGF
jgi:hypothetical protein